MPLSINLDVNLIYIDFLSEGKALFLWTMPLIGGSRTLGDQYVDLCVSLRVKARLIFQGMKRIFFYMDIYTYHIKYIILNFQREFTFF